MVAEKDDKEERTMEQQSKLSAKLAWSRAEDEGSTAFHSEQHEQLVRTRFVVPRGFLSMLPRTF